MRTEMKWTVFVDDSTNWKAGTNDFIVNFDGFIFLVFIDEVLKS